MEAGHRTQISVLSAGYAEHTKSFFGQYPHGLPCFLLRLQVEGRSTVRVGAVQDIMERGALLVCPPKTSYELTITASLDEPSCDFFVFCSGPWVEAWWQDVSQESLITFPMDEDHATIWRQLVHEEIYRDELSSSMAETLLQLLCLRVLRHKLLEPIREQNESSPAADQMRTFIEQKAVAEELSLQRVADVVGLSVSRAAHLFKETYGKTIVQHALEVRLNLARDRIHFSRMTLEQVAEASGFHSYSYFYRAFRNRYGISPKEYRSKRKS